MTQLTDSAHIKDFHLGSKSRVRINYSPAFTTTSDVRQNVKGVCMLAPALFCIAIDWIMSRCAGTTGITVGDTAS